MPSAENRGRGRRPPRSRRARQALLRQLAAALARNPADHAARQRYHAAMVETGFWLWHEIVYVEAHATKPAGLRLARLHLELAQVYAQLGDFLSAAVNCRRALQRAPGLRAAQTLMGRILLDDQRPAAAIPILREGLAQSPRDAESMVALGGALIMAGPAAEGESWLQRALQADADAVGALLWQSRLRTREGRLDDALACLDRAVACADALEAPRAHYERALLRLRRGDQTGGWRDYESRFAAFPAAFLGFPHDRPMWDGQPLDGRTVFVHERDSQTDALLLARYLPRVAARGGRVMLGVRCELSNVLRRCKGVDCVSQPDATALEPFDVQVPMASLPAVLEEGLDAVVDPYVWASPRKVEAWARRLPANTIRVGLAWQGRDGDTAPAEAFDPLTRVAGARAVALNHVRRPAPADSTRLDILDHGVDLLDMDEVAAVVANLDLVIAVDTAVAHLAGAMGRPVWVLLRREPHWRWMDERLDSPWYPSMRLYRQGADESWDGLISRVAQALSIHLETLHGVAR